MLDEIKAYLMDIIYCKENIKCHDRMYDACSMRFF